MVSLAGNKARNRVPSSDSARARNAGFRPQVPAVARMGFFNGLLRSCFKITGEFPSASEKVAVKAGKPA